MSSAASAGWLRHQLAVASPLRLRGLLRGGRAALAPDGRTTHAEREHVAGRLAAAAGAHAVALTGSGTSALVAALRMVAARGPVALPAWGCIDLAAAAARAGVRVRLYDVDPVTLGADPASLGRALDAGAGSVVVAHLYGVPVDVDAVRAIAAPRGALVIEDAAQAAGATLRGRAAGALGDLVVRSFGRGKGTCAGSGGALLARDATLAPAVRELADRLGTGGRGSGTLAVTAAQWALGRPSIYGLPARLPGLRLGEMVYHPAGEPTPMSAAAVGLLADALDLDAPGVAARRALADAYAAAIPAGAVQRVQPPPGAVPGWLRYPVLDPAARTAPALGVLRGYPCTLLEMEPMQPLLLERVAMPGAERLARTLVTLPTHHLVSRADVERIVARYRGTIPQPLGVLVDAAGGAA